MDGAEFGYDFEGATWDLDDLDDRWVVRFILSQALYGEATGVYCGKSLYAARSLEAAQFYVRQAKQELNHLQLFGEIFDLLDMKPMGPHWVIRLLSSHNNYYPLKVLMEHALGEGMVHDIFKDVLLQTLPDDYENMDRVKKKLRVIVKDEIEHVLWGEKESRHMVETRPWIRWPYYGLLELQLAVAPLIVRAFRGHPRHPVLRQVPAFVDHVKKRAWEQGRALGFVPEKRPVLPIRLLAMASGVALYLRSQLARSRSTLDKTYITELGFEMPK